MDSSGAEVDGKAPNLSSYMKIVLSSIPGNENGKQETLTENKFKLWLTLTPQQPFSPF